MRALVSVRLGADFSKLLTASAVSNLGDGVTMVAGPLLVSTLTTDPAAVAGAAFAQQLPWLLFALLSGAWADRLDRRRLVVAVNIGRALAIGVLTVSIAAGFVSVPLIYAVFFVLGTGETLADTASSAFVPAIVRERDLPTANSLLGGTFTVINQFVAKPFGAWLFAVAAAVPFGVNAASFLASALLIATLRRVPPPPPVTSARRSLSADIREGLRFLWGHRLLRTLAVTMAFGNLVFCAAFAIFVLYSREVLGLSSFGYGVLLTAFAIGGLAGTALAPWLLRSLGATVLLRAGLLIEVALHATLAATDSPWLAALAIITFSTHGAVWGTVVVTVRQRTVPPTMYGRATSVYALLDLGGAAVGSLLGGLLAQAYGLLATFWTAAAAMTLVAACAWRPLGIATEALRPSAQADPSAQPTHPLRPTHPPEPTQPLRPTQPTLPDSSGQGCPSAQPDRSSRSGTAGRSMPPAD